MLHKIAQRAFFMLCFCPAPLMGESMFFINTGNWFSTSVWSHSSEVLRIPQWGDDVYIRTVGEAIIGQGSAACGTVYLDGRISLSGLETTLTFTSARIGTIAGEGGLLKVWAGAAAHCGNGTVHLGYQSDSYGNLIVTGSGSRLSGNQVIGDGGEGEMTIENAGLVNAYTGIIGSQSSGEGSVDVTGAGSKWKPTSSLVVGDAGGGTLSVTHAGTVEAGLVIIASQLGSQGLVDVEGAGSRIDTDYGVHIGYHGYGILNIRNGGVVVSKVNANIIAGHSSATGKLEVSGIGSHFTSSREMYLAHSGNGSLNISDGGKVTINNILVTNHVSATGNVSVRGTSEARGILETRSIAGGPAAAMSFDGGILRATGDVTQFLSNFPAGTIQLLSGSAYFDTQNHLVGFAVPLQGPGGLVKLGSGTLTMSKPHALLGGGYTYMGITRISEGALIVDDRILSSPVIVEGAGLLGGKGTFDGPVSCDGSIAPGTSAAGTMIMNSGLELGSAAKLNFQLGGSSDRVDVVGNLTLDGSLEVAALAGFGEGTYTLASYTGLLTDNGLAIATMPTGFQGWIDTSSPGQIRLVVSESLSALQQWQVASFGSMSDPNASLLETPHHDGVPNLLKYAFNLNPSGPDRTQLSAGTGTKGLPSITMLGSGATVKLRLEYLRQKASSKPGIRYIPQFSSNLSDGGGGAWSPATGTETVTSIDATWERVVIEEAAAPGESKLFARVKVTEF